MSSTTITTSVASTTIKETTTVPVTLPAHTTVQKPPMTTVKQTTVAFATSAPVTAPAVSTTTWIISTLPAITTTERSAHLFISGLHHIPGTLLEERLELLGCDLPLLPTESRLWNGNETHELLLPTTVPSDCSSSLDVGEDDDCPMTALSWEGSAEIQSGDVLLVRIDDANLVDKPLLNQTPTGQEVPIGRQMHEPTTAVYQVTRTGHDNCDVTEGILLDITPLKIDNRKVVTLYDKDLTEGINLLIVVSELWGNKKCVRLKVIVKSDNCGENEDCSGKGLCYSNISMEGYECQCCPGFVGPHCEEQDACYPSPCKNNGICVDISQGHEGSTFQCLCPYGYTGKTCEEETDPCTSMPCQNGATCMGNVTQFRCTCAKGFSGSQCQHNLNECESSPCVHGICMDQEEGFKCYCEQGYTGAHCEYEYNECESSPCVNGGLCTDHVAGYTCQCGRGFTGKRCHIKVDLCEPNPCPEPLYCLDRGNNYSCVCSKEFTEPDCLIPRRSACSRNPCSNGGTCWSSPDSFYCACRPEYTGKTCEDEFVAETIANVDPLDGDKQQPDLDIKVPMSIHLDHLHNLYFAAATLICAFLFVAAIVTACHCRVNKPYKRFALRSGGNGYWLSWKTVTSSATNGTAGTAERGLLGANMGNHPAALRRPVEQNLRSATNVNTEWFSGKDKAPMATPSRNLPSLDTTDMYYTLDFSDSQSSPLIQ